MTRVTLVAPVLSSAVPDLGRLLVGDPYVVRDQLARTFGEWRAAAPAASPSLIHEHEAVGAGLLPDRLLTAERTVPAATAAHGVKQVHVSVGLHGVIAIVAVVEVLDPAALEIVEDELRPVVADLAAEVREHLLSSPLIGRLDDETIGRYPVDRFLYWHRLVHDGGGAWDALLCNDVDAALASGSRLRVGDGYSALVGESVEVVRDVLRGLVRAQELWLTITTVSQQLLLETARLTQPADLTEAQLTAEQSSATVLADREALRNGVIRDEITYATGTQRAVLRAAAQAWQSDLDTTQVAGRLDVLLHVVGRRLAEQQAQRQARLNAVVLALTVVGALALLLGLFETGVGDGLGLLDPVRIAVSLAVAAAAVASLLLAFRTGRRNASRD